MARNQVTLTFAGDTKSLERAFGRVDSEAGRLKGRLSGLGTALKVGLGSALVGLGAAAKIGWDEFAEGQRVSAQTAAVLKSTGGAAKVTQGQIEDLAGSLSNLSGADDEAIQAGQNLLLTFTNVQNRAGKGNDIFNQATKTMLDMSTAMGTDAKGTAIQLGKALNDPVKGISALTRVGVTFTQGQKDSIKAMVAAGNTAGAQKVILAELQKEFGGSAEAAGKTLPGQLAIAKNALAGLAGEVVAKVVPALLDVVTWVRSNWPQISAVFRTVFDAVRSAVQTGIDWIKANVVPAIQNVIAGAKAAWDRFGGIVKAAFDAVLAVIRPALRTVKAVIDTALALLRGDWSKVWDGLKDIAANALRAAAAAIRGLVSIFLAAARALGIAIWDGIKAGLAALAGLASKLVQGIGGAIKTAATWALTTAAGIGKSLMQGIWDGFFSLKDWIWEKVKGVLSGIKDKVLGLFGIGSPSKVFAEEVGKPLAQGIAAGLVGAMNFIDRAVEVVAAGINRAVEKTLRPTARSTAEQLATWWGEETAGSLALAMAGLTATVADDFAALQTMVSEAEQNLMSAHGPAAQAAAARALAGARSNLAGLGPLERTASGDLVATRQGSAADFSAAALQDILRAKGQLPAVSVGTGTGVTGAPVYHITINTAATGDDVVRAIQQYERQNGPLYARA